MKVWDTVELFADVAVSTGRSSPSLQCHSFVFNSTFILIVGWCRSCEFVNEPLFVNTDCSMDL